MKEDVMEVSKGDLLHEDVCGSFEEEDRREAVLGLCEHEGRKLAQRTRWLKSAAWRSRHSSVKNRYLLSFNKRKVSVLFYKNCFYN